MGRKVTERDSISSLVAADIIAATQYSGTPGLYLSKKITFSDFSTSVANLLNLADSLKFGGLISGASSLALNTRYIYSANSIATHTLPATPSNGDRVMLDHNEDGTSIITISGNGKNIRQSPNPTASTIQIDLVGAHIEFIFSTDADEWIVANFSGPFGSSTVNGTLLTTIDMTNGGANDLNNIDITWQASWDNYDYCELVIDTAESSSSGQIAWALSNDGGSTWVTFAGGSREAISWTNQSFGLGVIFNAWARMNIKGHQKYIHCHHFSGGNNLQCGAAGTGTLGYAYTYGGGTLTNLTGVGNWDAWDTGSDGLNTYMLRFVHEVGNFTSGTLKIIGYNYPS